MADYTGAKPGRTLNRIDWASPGMIVGPYLLSKSECRAHAQALRSPRGSLPCGRRRHAVRPDGRRQHALVHRLCQTAGRAYGPRQARARDRRGGDSLQRRDRQDRRCLGHLRPRRDAVDDRAAGRGSRPPAAGGVRRRDADQRQVLQPGDRPGAAGGSVRREIHRGAQPAAHDGLCARGLPRRQGRALPGGAGRSLRPAEGRIYGEPALRDLGRCMRPRSGACTPIPR